MKTRFLFFFFASILISSCTIQKRVHNKGWFVQWHTTKKSSGGETDQAEAKRDVLSENETSASKPAHTEKRFETMSSDDQAIQDEIFLTENPSEGENDPVEMIKAVRELAQESISERISPFIKTTKSSSKEKEQGASIGLVLTIIGSIIAALAILIFLSIASAESASLAIMGGVILSILSALFLSIGIFYSIRRRREKKHPEKREARLERIRQKKASPDYNPNRFNVVIALVSFTVVTTLFVILTRN